jgi:hypothetical protein
MHHVKCTTSSRWWEWNQVRKIYAREDAWAGNMESIPHRFSLLALSSLFPLTLCMPEEMGLPPPGSEGGILRSLHMVTLCSRELSEAAVVEDKAGAGEGHACLL